MVQDQSFFRIKSLILKLLGCLCNDLGRIQKDINPFVTPDKYIDRLHFANFQRSPFITPTSGSQNNSSKTGSASSFSGSGHNQIYRWDILTI